ncbi:bacteriochlorophyll 4-vinyl reductase [Salinarimonas ramus]|uniref:Bacteriochlorophyll 4-vinyl reductase n=1 Tax=Salinarimonas ramus TaxID=690164 RepID=A0A917V4L5_9HYPH|nr:bacteriochlorophyll 4-vinyl reductase [Salinarimonas ramus]GGK35972.1 bacteriochlorophyll 4-vinyl reductase [Salinarimonas ramus]
MGAPATPLDPRAPSPATTAPARIGPNAIIQMRAVMIEALGRREAGRVLAQAGLETYVFAPPATMVDEREVAALHAALRAGVGEERAAQLGFEAGLRTGRYLVENRIPAPVRLVLRLSPAPLASRILLAAIARHSWTFAGSGVFAILARAPARVRITSCPLVAGVRLARPGCAFYAGTFEALYRTLVHPRARCVQTACEGMGDPACLFEISW